MEQKPKYTCEALLREVNTGIPITGQQETGDSETTHTETKLVLSWLCTESATSPNNTIQRLG